MAAFVPFLRPGHYPVLLSFFIFVPTVFGILFASMWLLASDVLENAPKTAAARSFSQIGASSLAGGTAGGVLAKALSSYLDPKLLVFLGALVTLIVAGLVIHMHQKFPSNIAPAGNNKGSEKTRLSSVLSKKYARTLLLISMAGALAGLFIDFQFYATASSIRMGSKGNANFFANFYILPNLSSLLIQLFLAPKIQDRLGLRGGLLILPLALLGSASFVTAVATALTRSVLKVTESGLKSSIHRSMWEQAFIPVDWEERSFVKVFVDGIGARFAEGIGATLLFLWLTTMEVGDPSSLNTIWIAWAVLATAAVWLLLTRGLRVEIAPEPAPRKVALAPADEREAQCARFPDQCPCTTEWGKGIK